MGAREFLTLAALTSIPAGMIAWLSLFAVRRLAPKFGLVDRPSARKVHTHPTALGGGLGVWLGVVTTIGVALVIARRPELLQPISAWIPAGLIEQLDGVQTRIEPLLWILTIGTLLMGLGLCDDRWGVPWKLRLGTEFVLAAIVVWGADIRLTAFIQLPFLPEFLSVLWIVALINVFNMLDNMDGLSGGVATIVSLMLAGAMWLTPDPDTDRPQLLISAMLFVIAGSLVGFLWHNFTPSRIFLGDAGAYFVGFFLAVATLLATFANYTEPRPHTVLVPLCVMALPLYDLFTVLALRLHERRSPFEADRRHFSHRLVDLGLTKGQAVGTIYLVTATCGLAALVLTRVNLVEALLVLAIILCLLGLVVILESTGWWRGRKP